MRLITLSQILTCSSCILLAGCADGVPGTSSAGFTKDEDAYSPSSTGTPGNSGTAAGTALFENRSGSQLYGTSPFPETAGNSFDNLEIVSSGLKSKITVLRVGSERTEGNLLSVFAGLKNKSAHKLPLEVQTVYKDKSDHTISDGRASWVPITLKPHEETQYRSVALSEDASDFLVRVRAASGSDAATQ